MHTIQVTHAQQRYGEPDDPAQVDVLRVTYDGTRGVYFSSAPESAYRWGCSRTYACAAHMPGHAVDRCLREFMAENGQTLVEWVWNGSL